MTNRKWKTVLLQDSEGQRPPRRVRVLADLPPGTQLWIDYDLGVAFAVADSVQVIRDGNTVCLNIDGNRVPLTADEVRALMQQLHEFATTEGGRLYLDGWAVPLTTQQAREFATELRNASMRPV